MSSQVSCCVMLSPIRHRSYCNSRGKEHRRQRRPIDLQTKRMEKTPSLHLCKLLVCCTKVVFMSKAKPYDPQKIYQNKGGELTRRELEMMIDQRDDGMLFIEHQKLGLQRQTLRYIVYDEYRQKWHFLL